MRVYRAVNAGMPYLDAVYFFNAANKPASAIITQREHCR